MLSHTFSHMPSVSALSEENFWKQGISSWHDFLHKEQVLGVGKKRKIFFDDFLRKSREALLAKDHLFFAQHLHKGLQWRAYDFFKEEALYFDLEADKYGVTLLSFCTSSDFKVLVRGVNLYRDQIVRALTGVKMLVSFNGSSYDLFLLKKHFGIEWKGLHIDLRHVCSKLGYVGGLKAIEKKVGIAREFDFKGGDPAKLYRLWHATRDEYYLKLLLEYNKEDAYHLYYLAEKAVPKLWKRVVGRSQIERAIPKR